MICKPKKTAPLIFGLTDDAYGSIFAFSLFAHVILYATSSDRFFIDSKKREMKSSEVLKSDRRGSKYWAVTKSAWIGGLRRSLLQKDHFQTTSESNTKNISKATYFLYLVIIFQFDGNPIEANKICSERFGDPFTVFRIRELKDFLNAKKSLSDNKYLNEITTENISFLPTIYCCPRIGIFSFLWSTVSGISYLSL